MSSFTAQKDSEEDDSFEIVSGSSGTIDHAHANTNAATHGFNRDSASAFPWQPLFDQYGIGEYAEKIEPATGAKSLEDLKMLNTADERMIDEAAKLMSMMIIPKAKFKNALKALDSMDAKNPKNGRTPRNGDATASISKLAPSAKEKQDDHEAGDTVTTSSPPAECVVVCIDRSYSMKSPFNEQTAWGENATKQTNAHGGRFAQRTRMDAVKQVFYGFRDRTETMSTPFGQHQLGLLSFDCDIEMHLGLTSSFDLFEKIIDDIEERNNTSIYSAISAAIDLLRPVFKAHPETDLRVLCLTDGENNGGIGPEIALGAANSIGAVVDAIIVGDNPDHNLRKIVTATEGECFQITTLSEGFQLMEGEGVISLSARRGGVEKPKFVQRQKVDFSTVEAQTITRGTVASAKTTAHRRKVTGKVISLNASTLMSQYSTSAVSTTSKTLKRIMRELEQVAEGDDKAWMHSGEGVHIFPDEKDITKIRVLIQGPVGTPFEGGTFLLNVFVPSSYPFKPPNITFVTPIYHCNVSESGRICMDILQSGWNPSMSIPKALECVRMLMSKPSADNALRQWVAEEVLAYEQHGDTTADGRRYLDNAKAKTLAEASRSVDEWKSLWNLIDQA